MIHCGGEKEAEEVRREELIRRKALELKSSIHIRNDSPYMARGGNRVSRNLDDSTRHNLIEAVKTTNLIEAVKTTNLIELSFALVREEVSSLGNE